MSYELKQTSISQAPSYQEIYYNAIEGIYQSTPGGQYINVNPALVKLYGYDSADELIAELTDISTQLYVEPSRRLEFMQLLEQQGDLADFESQVYRRDGSTIWISETARLVRDQSNQPICYEGIVSNISKRKQVEEALRRSNTELAETIQALQTTQNELLQSEKMAALGQLVAGVAHEVNTPLGAIRSSIGTISKYLEHILKSFPSLIQTLSLDETQQFLNLLELSLTQSLLSAKEERKLRRALTEELNAKGIADADILAETLTIMGIHTEVNSFLGLLHHPHRVEIIKLAFQLSGLQRSAQTITTATDRASKVVFALKSYAHRDYSDKMVEAIITDGIDTVLTLYQHQLKRGVEVIRDYALVPPIWCYPDELNQVWTNIIYNAIQAMDNQGILTIVVAEQSEGIQVKITDTGKGIPSEIRPRIFEPFFTTKPVGEGSGLGLNVVKTIIERHNGQINFTTQPGQTTFDIILPKIQPHHHV